MSIYSFKIHATARNIDVELAENEATRFVKPPKHKVLVQTDANGAMTEFHYSDKAVSIRTLLGVTSNASLFVESSIDPITIYISGETGIRVQSEGDEQVSHTEARTAYALHLGDPVRPVD